MQVISSMEVMIMAPNSNSMEDSLGRISKYKFTECRSF
jgi:hypothetical protein